MTRLLQRTGLAFVLLAYFVSVGGHFAVTQAVAWGTMIAASVKRGTSVSQAVSETLDGEHPCRMCLKVAQARAGENPDAKPDGDVKEKVKSLGLALVVVALPASLCGVSTRADARLVLPSRCDPPPVPPPRNA
jgi:hypothetical protein